MKTCVLLFALLSFGCATVPARYSIIPDADGNNIVKREAPKNDHSFGLMFAAIVVATVADVETTFGAIDRCATCEESNPILRPFVKRGRGSTYAVTLSLNAVQMWVAHRAKARGDRHWYIAPAIGAGVHGAAAVANSQQ